MRQSLRCLNQAIKTRPTSDIAEKSVPSSAPATVVKNQTVSGYFKKVFMGALKSGTRVYRISRLNSELYQSGQVPSWNNAKEHRQAIRDLKLTAAYLVPPTWTAFTTGGSVAFLLLGSYPFLWKLVGHRSTISPSYGIVDTANMPPFYPAKRVDYNSAKVFASHGLECLQSSLPKSSSAYQKWSLFHKVAESWLSGSTTENLALDQSLVNDLRTIFRTVSLSAPEICHHLPLNQLDSKMFSAGVKVLNGRPLFASLQTMNRRYGTYSLLKKYYQITNDDKYVYDRNVSIDIDDAFEILNHRVGIPAELLKKLPESNYGSLVNSYLGFSQEVTQKLDKTEDQLICFLLMRSLVMARCSTVEQKK